MFGLDIVYMLTITTIIISFTSCDATIGCYYSITIKLPGLPCPIRLVIGGTIDTLRLDVRGCPLYK
jgi:hypothetical protein